MDDARPVADRQSCHRARADSAASVVVDRPLDRQPPYRPPRGSRCARPPARDAARAKAHAQRPQKGAAPHDVARRSNRSPDRGIAGEGGSFQPVLHAQPHHDPRQQRAGNQFTQLGDILRCIGVRQAQPGQCPLCAQLAGFLGDRTRQVTRSALLSAACASSRARTSPLATSRPWRASRRIESARAYLPQHLALLGQCGDAVDVDRQARPFEPTRESLQRPLRIPSGRIACPPKRGSPRGNWRQILSPGSPSSIGGTPRPARDLARRRRLAAMKSSSSGRQAHRLPLARLRAAMDAPHCRCPQSPPSPARSQFGTGQGSGVEPSPDHIDQRPRWPAPHCRAAPGSVRWRPRL
ncbi:unnamed protein product [Acanthosepion pharaonis]|uniref:Uncharacterized protein n=1 Tax=Acanthosepion pharaonis TaxID=158019 RepID=A0A812DLL3_ACAPH|nr:unnamed protein product [Sepia pharaonis]